MMTVETEINGKDPAQYWRAVSVISLHLFTS